MADSYPQLNCPNMKWISVMIESHGAERGGRWDIFPQRIYMKIYHNRTICWCDSDKITHYGQIRLYGVRLLLGSDQNEKLADRLTRFGKFCTLNRAEALTLLKAAIPFERIPALEWEGCS